MDNLLTRKRKENFNKKISIKIYIRKRFKADVLIAPQSFEKQKKYLDMVEMYDGLYQKEFEKMMEELQAKSVKGAESTI